VGFVTEQSFIPARHVKILATEEVVCERCGGTGTVITSDHKDVCPECMGLGMLTMEKTEEPLSKSKHSIKVFVEWVIGALIVFYGIFFYLLIVYHLDPTEMIIILLVGHTVAFGSIVLYLLLGSVYRATG
jgi:hypothetical protein